LLGGGGEWDLSGGLILIFLLLMQLFGEFVDEFGVACAYESGFGDFAIEVGVIDVDFLFVDLQRYRFVCLLHYNVSSII
jgi:hypothetical protein